MVRGLRSRLSRALRRLRPAGRRPPLSAAAAPGRGLALELSDDPRFGARVRRLAATSAVALGVIWLLARVSPGAHPLASAALLGGWMLMPAILWLSLARPGIRRALVVPSALVTCGLVGVCLGPLAPLARVGWTLTLVGVLLGDVLGMWLWFRWLPVPEWLRDPFGPGRWALIAVHVGLVVLGLSLVALAVAVAGVS